MYFNFKITLTVPVKFFLFQFVVRASGQVSSLTSVLTVPVIETLTILLRQGETYISDPQHVILVLGALEFVPLENQCIGDYYSAFHAIHEALYAIILCYPKVSELLLNLDLVSFKKIKKCI